MTSQASHRRVAVTGMGAITAAGCSLDDFWSGLCSGRSFARRLHELDEEDVPVRIGCRADAFVAEEVLGAKEARRMDRYSQLALSAAIQAIDDAALPSRDPARCAVVAGSGFGGIRTLEVELHRALRDNDHVAPLAIPKLMPNAAAALVAMRLGWTGPSMCVTTACASSAHATGEGVRMLRDNSADVVLAGGAESPLGGFVLSAFAGLHALSRRGVPPELASRPFDAQRDGFVLGEGSAFCVLERLEDARARGARIYATIDGYGRNSDSYHLVMPSPSGRGAEACMRLALDDAGVSPDRVGSINAHGTSTVQNDLAEAKAITSLFGEAPPVVTAVKGAIGHLIGAAGATEMVASCLTVWHGKVPPTANQESRDPQISLDVARDLRALGNQVVISNSFGFGGHNAALVVAAA